MGLKFIETVVILYSESTVLQTAGSSRGSPNQDMLLSNCRYLIGQLNEQLGIVKSSILQGSIAVNLVQSLTSIAKQRPRFLNLIVVGFIELIEEDMSIRIPSVLASTSRSEVSTTGNLALTIKQALLELFKQDSITSRQRSGILEGLSLLGEKSNQRTAPRDEILDSLQHFSKRLKTEVGYEVEFDDSSPSGHAGRKTGSVFNGKLDLEEIQTLLDLLKNKGHGSSIEKLCEQLPEDVVINLVIQNFSRTPDLPTRNQISKDSKPVIKTKQIKPKLALKEVKTGQNLTHQMKPMTISGSDRLILREFSCAKLMKIEDALDGGLPVGMRALSRLSSMQEDLETANISLDLIMQLIGSNFQTQGPMIHELITDLMFSLFLKYGSSLLESEELTVHDKILIRILEILSELQFGPKDRTVRDLLLELPSLPSSIIHGFFTKMLKKDSTIASSFLIAAVALMEAKPLLKGVLLNCVLESCITEDLEVREKAIRLVKNRLHVDAELTEKIEDFATENLRSLTSHHQEVDAGRRCHLYLALCTRKASLLRTLMEVYAQVNENDKLAIQENTKQLSEAMPFLLPEIFHLINALPDGSEKLLLFLISIFPERVPPQPVVDACLERYNATKNVRFLVPILPGLPKKRVLEIVPLLTELPVEEFTPIVTELVNQPQYSEEAIEPSEVLISLMTSSDNPAEAALSTIRTALDHCIKRLSTVFDKEVLAGTLNKLIHMGTLPMLFMRTVLLAVSREKELGTFVLQTVLSPSVVASKIKTDASQWKGYLLLLQRLPPTAFFHLLSLPTRLMTTALKELPQSFTEQFSLFVNSEESNIRVSKEAVLAIDQILNDIPSASSKKTSSSQAAQSDREGSTSMKSQGVGNESPTTSDLQSLKEPK